jgi:glycosyltransferase involved in cell wall biosynthesis
MSQEKIEVSIQRPVGAEKKIRILTLSDTPLATSGIGIQAKQLIMGLLDTGRYQVFSIGGAVAHHDYNPQVVTEYNGDWVIFPTKGFGDESNVHQWLRQFNPDIVLAFTDPRFFIHLFKSEDEIRDMAPLILWTVWDNEPVPLYNKEMYSSSDDIVFFSRYSYEFHKPMQDMVECNFHCCALARESGLFFPMEESMRKQARAKIFGDKNKTNTNFLYVSRNARRKRPSDILVGFQKFINRLTPEDKANSKPVMIMHTNPLDHEGPNLFEVVNLLGLQDYVLFSSAKSTDQDMNILYNSVDCTINASMNEGFGMSVHESLLAGTPVIATRTGGMTEQMTDGENVFGIIMDPDQKNLVGSQLVPYIFEDLASPDTIADSLMTMYRMPAEERRRLGLMGQEHLAKNNKMEDIITFWDSLLTERVNDYKNPERVRYNFRKM